MKILLLLISVLMLNTSLSAQNKPIPKAEKTPFVWEGANLYFLLADRFNNGNFSNDIQFGRTNPTNKLRGFEGGDLKGITQKINEGYFDKLGVTAIWISPIVEQIHGGVDEGQGITYGFHGYWTRDWSTIDPNFGNEKDLMELVDVAHSHNIRILLDAVINHTGPVTEQDPVWPQDWVRTSPQCDYKSYNGTTECTLVANLPDILTESYGNVELPAFLIEKWKKEGRYEIEMRELDTFFNATGYPRAPRFYIIKWLTDYIRKYGIDGYRADTVKHTDPEVWTEFKTQCNIAFADWKKQHPEKALDDNDFYTIAEVYGYGISAGKDYDFGDRKVNYFDQGFNNLINFEFKWDAGQKKYDALFSKYSDKLNNVLEGKSVLNYLSSHDDSQPFDAKREKCIEAGTKLLLCPGVSQIYYGDETARRLVVDGAQGDVNLRSDMNWDDLKKPGIMAVLEHWQKLGKFRHDHPAVGAGIHRKISDKPYAFSRGFDNGIINDRVIIALDVPAGVKKIKVSSIFKDGTVLKDAYSGKTITVKFGMAEVDSEFNFVLLELKK